MSSIEPVIHSDDENEGGYKIYFRVIVTIILTSVTSIASGYIVSTIRGTAEPLVFLAPFLLVGVIISVVDMFPYFYLVKSLVIIHMRLFGLEEICSILKEIFLFTA